MYVWLTEGRKEQGITIMLSELFFSMIMFCCIGAVICVILRVAFCLSKHRKYVLTKEVPIALLAAYCAGLFSMTIPVYKIVRYAKQMINGVYHSVNMIPFRTITGYIFQSESMQGISLTNLMGNILLFMPLGILLPIVFKRCNTLLKSLIVGTVISALIETAQYFLGRSADIDDVILNVIGTVVGVGVYSVLKGLIER